MPYTSRALTGVLTLGLFAGCSSDPVSSSPGADDGSSSSAAGSTGDADSGDTGAPEDDAQDNSGDPDPSGTPATTGPEPTGGSDDGSSGAPDTTGDDPTTGEDDSTGGAGETTGGAGETTGAVSALCGDGFLDAGEECDEGDDNANDADCTASCTTNVCGDGFQHAFAEACDDGNDDSTDACVSCISASCGDGFIQAGVEDCDNAGDNADGADCTSACTTNVCGDGYQHAFAESCDDGNEDNTDGCISCIAASCGDGFIQAGVETCDDTNDNNLDSCQNDCSAHVVTKLALGGDHTCALFSSGNIKCWGNGASGRLGYGNTDSIGDDETPADVGFVDLREEVEDVIAGISHTCVAFADGTAQCFGSGGVGQLGGGNPAAIGDNESPRMTAPIDLGGSVLALGSGGGAFHSCAAVGANAVQCWGQNANGKLGLPGHVGHLGDNETPASVGTTDVGGTPMQLAMGSAHSCALVGSSVRCWGSNANGALGYGGTETIGDDETPATAGDVPLTDVAVQVATGWYHSCALLEGGSVQCWGRGNNGRLGYGNTAYVGVAQTPADAGLVDLSGPAAKVSAGFAHTCALLNDGRVQCWGHGANGQLGHGNTDAIGDNETPASIGAISLAGGVSDIETAGNHVCVITDAGGVKCWGQGGNGRLGYGNTESLGDDETLSELADVPLLTAQ